MLPCSGAILVHEASNLVNSFISTGVLLLVRADTMSQLHARFEDSQYSTLLHHGSSLLDAHSQLSNANSAPPSLARNGNQAGTVVSRIEDILESLFDGLKDGAEDLSIPFRSRRTSIRTQQQTPTDSQDTDAGASSGQITRQSRDTINFPGKTAQEAEKFSKSCRSISGQFLMLVSARLLSILQLCHGALVSGNIITKRSVSRSPIL